MTRWKEYRSLLAALALVASGCAAEIDGATAALLDPADASFALDAASAAAVLELANEADFDELVDQVGLHPEAAQAIVDAKLGPDGEPLGDDDVYFAALVDLDAVPFVGPIAYDRLREHAAAAGFGTPTDDAELATTSEALTSGSWTWTDRESLFIQLVNRARSRRGIATLRRDVQVGCVARRWSGRMASRNRLFHNPDFSTQITRWRTIGENVGWTSATGTWQEQVARLHAALMNSPGHRANILGRGFRHVGAGVRTGNGKMWVTQNFTGTDDPGTSIAACR